LRIFTDFVQKCDQIARAQDADVPDKLRMLFSYISADVYEMIEDCAMRWRSQNSNEFM